MSKFSAAVARMFTVSALMAFDASAAQYDYPNKPVRLVSGYAPGGTTSLVGRLIGEELTESWGQQFLQESRRSIFPTKAQVRPSLHSSPAR